jgi:polysaccharide chain length determinant protein (PEP-CTERM system associated)
MSVEFRQRTPGEYAGILWNRKWLIILPTIAIAIAVSYVVYHLPSIYESSSLIVIRPPNISPNLIPLTTNADMTLRLNSIDQQVKSRSSLEPIITKYDLYNGSVTKEPMENLLERMMKDMRVEIVYISDETPNAFKISYRGKDPKITQKVTAEIASKYIDAQTKDNSLIADSTKAFFEKKLAEVKKELDAIDRRRLEFMQQNLAILPSGSDSMISELTSLREQQNTLTIEIGRMNNQRRELVKQLSEIKTISQIDVAGGKRELDPKKTAFYIELRQRKVQVESELNNMRRTLTDKNPDVIQKKGELETIKQEMAKVEEEEKEELQQRAKELETRPDLRISSYESAINNLDNEIESHTNRLSQLESQIAEVQSRVNSVPGVSVALEGLDREYNLKKNQHDELLTQQRAAEMMVSVNRDQQGEKMQVIDPANFPQSPVSPKRPILMAMGLGAGLAVGLFLTLLVEIPKLLTMQSVEDVEFYTGLPVILAMPELLTPSEERHIKQRRTLAMAAGIAAAIVSIPLLTFILKITHVFDRFVT